MGSKHQQLTKSVSEVMDMDMRQANLAYYCTNEIIVFKLHGLNGKTVDFTVPPGYSFAFSRYSFETSSAEVFFPSTSVLP